MPAGNESNSGQESLIKGRLRVEIESTCQDFHQLLEDVPGELLDKPSHNPEWTIRETLYHMSLAPRNLPSDVRMIRHLKWVPKLPAGPFNRLNRYLTRRGARNLDKAALAARYDEAHARTIDTLETIQDQEWALGVDYPDWDPMLSGFVTLERLFHYIRLHFDAHAEEIRAVVKSNQ
ncbi:MAG: DinB family protein [Anaerolineales bacterium]|nr:DinB family protein [Anaerolineales bacterium]